VGIPPRATLAHLERVYDDAVASRLFDTKAIAGKHKLSVRALRKRLAARGTSHRKQMDRARRLVAEATLQRSACSLEQVAMIVGYGDITAFVRAFRRWTGSTPGAYRRHVSGPRVPARGTEPPNA